MVGVWGAGCAAGRVWGVRGACVAGVCAAVAGSFCAAGASAPAGGAPGALLTGRSCARAGRAGGLTLGTGGAGSFFLRRKSDPRLFFHLLPSALSDLAGDGGTGGRAFGCFGSAKAPGILPLSRAGASGGRAGTVVGGGMPLRRFDGWLGDVACAVVCAEVCAVLGAALGVALGAVVCAVVCVALGVALGASCTGACAAGAAGAPCACTVDAPPCACAVDASDACDMVAWIVGAPDDTDRRPSVMDVCGRRRCSAGSLGASSPATDEIAVGGRAPLGDAARAALGVAVPDVGSHSSRVGRLRAESRRDLARMVPLPPWKERRNAPRVDGTRGCWC